MGKKGKNVFRSLLNPARRSAGFVLTKTIIIIVLLIVVAAIVTLSLRGCGSDTQPPKSEPQPTVASSVPPSPEQSAEPVIIPQKNRDPATTGYDLDQHTYPHLNNWPSMKDIGGGFATPNNNLIKAFEEITVPDVDFFMNYYYFRGWENNVVMSTAKPLL